MQEPTPFPLPVGSGDTPQLYRLPGLKFQALCRDLLDSGADPEVKACREYGINGQAQHGIDLIADRKDGGTDVAQCKCERDFTTAKIRAASLEFLKYLGLWKSRGVRRFIVLVGSEVNQRQRQEEILEQTKEFKEQHGISYELWPSTRIVNKLRPYRGIVSQHLNPALAETLCGPTHASSLQLELAKHVALADHLISALTDAADEKLSLMREKWRRGHRRGAREILALTKNDRVTWITLSPKVQAGFLRFESSVALEAEGDPGRAETLLNEAQSLSSGPDDARLRAAILWHRGDLDGALKVLDVADTDAPRHFKAFLLITMRRVEEAEIVLNQISEETAETFQLRGLCSLANGRLGEARLALQKGLEKSPDWVSLQFTAAVIDYFSALTHAIVPPFIPAWPEPIPSIYVLQDDEARERLSLAMQRFQRMAADAEFDKTQRLCLETWQIACLANDLDRQDQFESEVKRILESNPAHHRVLAWAIVARMKALIEGPAEVLRQLVIDGKADPEQVLVLAQYHVAAGKPQKAATLLQGQRDRFVASGAHPIWVSWAAQVEALQGRTKEAQCLVDSAALSETESRLLKSRILLLEESGDPAAIRRYFLDSYEATGDPRFLLDLVETHARAKEWQAAADHSQELLEQINTPEVLRLVAFCSHEGGSFSLCLQLLNTGQSLYPKSRMPADLRRMRVHCQIELGLLPAAIEEAERLVREEPSLQNLLGLTQIYLSKGDFRRLCLAAHDILVLDQVPSDVLLRLAGQTRWEDQALSIRLWRRAVATGLADQHVVPAIQLGFELALDGELADLTRRMEILGRSGQGGVRIASLNDVIAHAQAFHRQVQELNLSYQNAQLPIHLIAPRLNLTLADIYHDHFDENARAQFLWLQPCVFTRAGGRVLPPLAEVGKTECRLNADITAVLFAHHFGFLDAVEEAFAPIRIPQELIPCLSVMRDRLTSGQAKRILSYRKILSSQQLGRIAIAPSRPATRLDFPVLLRDGWASLTELALEERGLVVDFIPLVARERPVELTELPTDVKEVVIGLRAVLKAIKDQGALTSDEYERMIERQPLLRAEPETASPNGGARLYFSGTSIETFADLGLLDVLARHFQVFIEQQEFQRLQEEILSSERREALANWVAGLIAHLNEATQAVRYEMISSESLADIDEAGPKALGEVADELGVASLLTIIRLQGGSGDRAWIDDRWANSHHTAGRTPIMDSTDVLQQLAVRGIISRERYYDIISRMRAEGVCFVPASKDEILHHLTAARVDENGVSETTGLRNLRRGLAASFLDARFLRPTKTDGPSFDPGEYEFLIRSISAVSEALTTLWLASDVQQNERLRKADWIVSKLSVPHHALRKIAGAEAYGSDAYAFAVVAASLLTRTVRFPTNKAGDEAARAYNAWLYHRMLEQRFVLEPELLTQTATYLQKIIDQVWPKDLENHEDRVTAVLMQQYFLRLPEQIREAIAPNSNFLARIGVSSQIVVEVAGLRFERIQYLSAAREAINGRKGEANLLGTDRSIVFFSAEPVGNGFQFEHPDIHTRILVDDWLLRLLGDSPTRREAIALELQEMLDVPSKALRDSVSDLASTEDFVRRIEKGEALRELSLPYFYTRPEQSIRNKANLKKSDLLPTKPEALLQYLRLEEASSSGFVEAFRSAVNEMLEGLPLAQSLDRLFRLPIELPQEAIARVQALSIQDKEELVRSLLRIPNSPLSRIQLARVLDICFPKEGRFVSVWNILPAAHEPELRAYLTIVQWTFDEMLFRLANSRWSAPAILAVSWVHGDHLFSILRSYGWGASDIINEFSLTPSRVHRLFQDFNLLDRDAANPHNVSPEAFLICGLRQAPANTAGFHLEPELQARLRSLMLLRADGLIFPSLDLLPDVTVATNQLSSIFGYDRLAAFQELAEEHEHVPRVQFRETIQRHAFALLESDQKDGWTMLKAAFGDGPIPEGRIEEVRSILCKADFAGHIEGDPQDASARLLLASTFLKFVANDVVKSCFRQQLVNVGRELRQHSKGQEEIRILSGKLVEAALNLSQCAPTSAERVSEFAATVAELASMWPALGKEVLPGIQQMCDELPIDQTAEMWRLNLRLRSH